MTDHKKEEKDLLMNHEYDGIRELDNDLPPWWLNLFYITIVFGVIYILGYQVFHWFDSSSTEYRKEVYAREELISKAESADNSKVGGEANLKGDLVKGAEIYKNNCVLCHGSAGEGKVGPNLTDSYWIHGGNFESVLKTVSDGVPAKGMLAWKSTLGVNGVRQVSNYVMSLQGTNPPAAKAAEGILYEPIDTTKPLKVVTEEKALQRGADNYRQYCSACHGEDLKGGFASNLRDGVWTSGKGTLEELMKISIEGMPQNNMPAWKGVLSEKQILEINSYILKVAEQK